MNKQSKKPLQKGADSLQHLVSLELPLEAMKNIKGGGADGHDLVSPEFDLKIYSDGLPPPDR